MRPGPPNDPYSSLDSVQHLDRLLDNLHRVLERLAPSINADEQSPLRAAALELVPAASSIAASIRTLIREGYLVSALILMRPLLERIATLCYLEQNANALALWQQGWPHNTRPSLKQRVATMMPGASQVLLDRLASAVSGYNGLIHGDPAAAQQSLALSMEGVFLVTDRDYGSPGRANAIAAETTVALAFLMARTQEIFRAP